MKNHNYVKVLLYAYPRLDSLVEALESGVEVKALLSFRESKDVFTVFEELGEEIVTAKKLVLLKERLQALFQGCTYREKYLLEYKYFRRREILRDKYSGYEPECSERNYYRLQHALLEKLASKLIASGFDEKKFFEEFSDFPPFMRVYHAISSGKERAVVFKRTDRGIVFRQKSSCMGDGERFPRRTNSAIANSAAAARTIMAICVPESPDSDGFSGSSEGPGSVEAGLR